MAKKSDGENTTASSEAPKSQVLQKKAVKVEEVKVPFSLPNTKVHVKPILRSGKWLPDGHSGSFMYDHTSIGIQVPLDKDTGRLKNPLTPEEREFFENNSDLDLEGGDLNPYRKKDNFWHDFKVIIRKTDDIVDDKTILMTLHLNDPIQYLQYKVLMINSQPDGGLVAPEWDKRLMSGTYRIALQHEGQQFTEKIKKADSMKKAYKHLAKIDSSGETMYDFLTIYYLENAKSKRPSENSDKDFYYSEIQDLIDSDLAGVVEIIEDTVNYEFKLLVHRGLKTGALKMVGGGHIETIDGIPVGKSLYQAIQWLKDDKHQDEYLRLKNQIELAK
jgi:hypothetical protein